MHRIAATTATGIAAFGLLFGVACSSTSSTPPPSATANTTSTAESTGTAAPSPGTVAATQTTQATQASQPTQTAQPTAQLGDDLTTAELVKLAEPSVVRIETGSGVGSG